MFIIIFILCLFLITSYYYLLKGTVLGIMPNRGGYPGFFIFYQLVMYIVPSSLLLNYYNISSFWVAFKVQQDSVFWISVLVICSILLFYLSIALFTRFLPKYFMFSQIENIKNEKDILIFNRLCILVCLSTIFYLWFVLGVSHSFSLAIYSDESLSSLRYSLSGNTETKIAKHLFIFIIPILTCILASPIYNRRKLERLMSFCLIFFIASWGGSKAPLLSVFLIYIISFATFNRLKVSFSLVIKLVLFVFFILFVMYKVVMIQYGYLENISLFFDYFVQRTFVAQMIGVYEQFNIWLYDVNYIFHGIPFASYFFDYPQYHKDLMMISENRVDPDSIGIKNTFFIAEAFGMGGWALLILSPVITGLNFCLTYVWLVFLLNHFAFNNLEFTKIIVAISLFSYIGVTGGFSDLMLFKITIMITILISPFILTIVAYRKLKF
ncbi:hypothetical protein [uncultured Shewanella sp.]|uniref:hypothetical protein n=1 Tax=uncultured Shewanella sp. TaxID=173975 RepID=UPI0026085D91|nr:hypothetical protein [uncultured Shewanella sp.]